MNESRASRDPFPSIVVAAVVAGVTSGMVTATLMALGPLRGAPSSEAPLHRPLTPSEAPTRAGTEEMLKAIRALTAALERTALPSPERLRTAIPSASPAPPPPDSLAATLRSLNETLKRWERTPSLAPTRPTATISEAARAQGVRANELQTLAATFQEQGRETSMRALYLRSIDYMIDRFGIPTEIQPGQGGMTLSWRTESVSLHAAFVDGVVVYVESNAR